MNKYKVVIFTITNPMPIKAQYNSEKGTVEAAAQELNKIRNYAKENDQLLQFSTLNEEGSRSIDPNIITEIRVYKKDENYTGGPKWDEDEGI